ncbi:cupin domain-containing protein [Marinoscillum furvescens]|uniref:DUF985 domain-containing protein n=1 Tax=Marinoscillum furvescens DSM 4134 TaxID=1122208 RepID=A0A3D9KXC5_MARFU|nr:cupin domain-containing protein [Marinoscillum furvescens]RED93391.1 hypothetical protein C7460_12536 [Marinoscillum furvescens DSM 4134]
MQAEDWIQHLEMEAHPEGGYFKEVYRNPNTIQIMQGGGTRNLSTSIYFLLKSGQKSHFHQLESDELWYYHVGSSVTVHILDHGQYRQETLGPNVSQGEQLQLVIPRHAVFAAEVTSADSFTLMGCMVNPGFDFKDFRMPGAESLKREYPQYADLIESFTLAE